MNILFVGYGSIALKHRLLIQNKFNEAVFYVLNYGESYNNIEDIILIDKEEITLMSFRAIFITSPSVFHCDQIIDLIKHKIPIFIEKPICVNKNQWKRLNKLPKEKRKLIYVGCNLRFHSLTKFLKNYLIKNKSNILEVSAYAGSYLPDWRPKKDYRKLYSSIKNMGGGVDLDLIHEPDLLYYLFGKPESSLIKKRKISSLKIDSNDWAFIYFGYKYFSATIMLNYFRKEAKRKIEIVRETDILTIDFIKGNVTNSHKKLFSSKNDAMLLSYKDQIDYFFDSIKNKKIEMNNLNEGLEVINLIL